MRHLIRKMLFLITLSLISATGMAGWTLEKIDTDERGMYNSILVDEKQNFYISTYNLRQTALEYIYSDEDGIHFEIVDNSGDTGLYTSMAWLPTNYPVISYYDATNGDLKVAYRNQNGWSIQTIDSEGDVGKYTSIAVNSRGYPCISYFDASNLALKYAYADETGWTTETVSVKYDPGYYTALVLDDSDTPHIAYVRKGLYPALMYAYKVGWLWHKELAIEGNIRGVSMALTDDGTPYISFYTERNICFATKNGSHWYKDGFPSSISHREQSSIVLDPDDDPYITFRSSAEGHLNLFYRDGSQLEWILIDSSTNVGDFSAMAQDSQNQKSIAYFDDANKQLKLARGILTDWDIRTLHEDLYIGEYLCFHRDSREYTHVCYYDTSEKSLHYVHQDDSGWVFETVDRDGDVGSFSSMALDADNFPHISYYDKTNGDLKYAYQNGDGWHITTVDTDGDVGIDTSIRIDAFGYPHITYIEVIPGVSGHLKYAWMDGDGWHVQRLDPDSENFLCRFSSLQLDADGFEHICCQDAGTSALKYIYRDGDGWHTEIASEQGGMYPSLAFDTRGNPCVIHFDPTNTALKYSYRTVNRWKTKTVDDNCNVETPTTLVVDTTDHAHVIYFDTRNHALKYAFFDGCEWFVDPFPHEDICWSSLVVDDNLIPHICYSSSGSLYCGMRQNTPLNDQLGVKLWMPDDSFEPGDDCACSVYLCNPGEEIFADIPLFVILDVFGALYFAPSFSDFDFYKVDLLPGIGKQVVIPLFSWPGGRGCADGVFYAGLTTPEMDGLLGEMDMWTFGWCE